MQDRCIRIRFRIPPHNGSYDSPAFWGLINPEWSLCNKGRRQSPVNLEPQRLLFDPNLRPLHIDKHRISGLISNTGHSVIFTAGNETVANYDGMQTPVNISGGPLSYRYRFHEIHIHYGLHDQFGSEHSVEGYTFPAEKDEFFALLGKARILLYENGFIEAKVSFLQTLDKYSHNNLIKPISWDYKL
ncbi:carbonic anhydrase-related protein 10-like [Rhagoletis pomonella]|uniref:carbonic anhydrase-related protein 10-like n=1 Tax=Rhagoletis pomonella TaxID=28610 RepID=UPI0017873869|nr:carbonic anhydrase-related protein 10-like [Rhagoletis pomonella]